MKRPDRGAKGYVGGVASSRVPRGRKRQRARKKQPRQDESYTYPMLMGGRSVPATREKHLIRSLSRHALLLPSPCHSWISRSLFPPSNHTSRRVPGSPCSLPSLTKRHSHSPSRISLQNPLHQILCKFKFISSSASVHPIPIFSFLTARSPLVKFYEICFPSRLPEQ